MIKTAPHSTLSPQMGCIKKNKTLVCTHPDLLARICKLVDRKKFGLICFPRLIYCDQEPLLLLNLTVHLFGCAYKAIFFTPKSLNFSMGASLLAVAESIYYLSYLGQVVQTLDCAIHRINHYTVDNYKISDKY